MSELQDAVRVWIRAEYLYRLGPEAYQTRTAEWYENAEKELRRIATGKRRLGNAYEAIGGRLYVQPDIRKRKGK